MSQANEFYFTQVLVKVIVLKQTRILLTIKIQLLNLFQTFPNSRIVKHENCTTKNGQHSFSLNFNGLNAEMYKIKTDTEKYSHIS